MIRFDSKRIGVEQGEAALFSDFDSGGSMWTGEGERMYRQAIRFDGRFLSPPVVHCALSMWDIDRNANSRIEVGTENVTVAGFDVVFATWGDTRVARARVRWMAIGELDNEDDWRLY